MLYYCKHVGVTTKTQGEKIFNNWKIQTHDLVSEAANLPLCYSACPTARAGLSTILLLLLPGYWLEEGALKFDALSHVTWGMPR